MVYRRTTIVFQRMIDFNCKYIGQLRGGAMGFMRVLFSFIVLAGCLFAASSSAQEDNAQICMFRCAPVVGTEGYDQCITECTSEGDAPAGAAQGVDLQPIFGFWQGKHTACGTVSDDTWSIDASGASAYESTCKLLSSSRKGKTFSLRQRCEFFENEVEEGTVDIRLVRDGEIEINGTRYRRCSR